MENDDLLQFMKLSGKDPARLIFEDELTGLRNRRYLGNFFEARVEWQALEENPVSLIMIDLDHFKEVNDNFGHHAGDEVLVFISRLLEQAAGEKGIPIRYAGDEFMILLPQARKEEALAVCNGFVELVRQTPCQSREAEKDLTLTVSAGVATAPDDAADSKNLIQRADTALYLSKKTGRDRMADAADADPATAEAKQALLSRQGSDSTGRKAQLGQIIGYLRNFIQRKSQFILVEGAPGMGKTSFLGSVESTLAKTSITRVSLKGRAQELFRPYYLASDIVLALLDQEEDKGVSLVKEIPPDEKAALSYVLPHLTGEPGQPEENDAQTRERIFNATLGFISRIVRKLPLVVLVDDLHYVDEATLLLFRVLIQKGEFPVFICGTVTDPVPDVDQHPIARFKDAHGKEIGMGRVRLTPLTDQDVNDHLGHIFPGVRIPGGIARDLTLASQGNPLFLSEILYKLVCDKKISKKDNVWSVEALDRDYLPRSLEEIVSTKVAGLDQESREMLDTVSAFGENVSLSQLSGSTDEMEARVLDFLDKAVTQGLVSLDFAVDDENIRFLSSHIAKMVYGGIEKDRKEKLHEHIGDYQESLLKEGLLPSAAILAYHYRRSANLEKAQTYEALQARHNSLLFNSGEAAGYTGEVADDMEPDVPLPEPALAMIPHLVRSFLVALRNTKLYPKGSALTAKAVDNFMADLEKIFQAGDRVHLGVEKDELQVNGEAIDISEFKSTAETFMTFFRRLELGGIIFKTGLSFEEVSRMLEVLSEVDRKSVNEGFWMRLCQEHELALVLLRQVRYALKKGEPGEGRKQAGKGDEEPPSESLDEGELDLAAAVMRSFLGAASKIRLYPPEGPVAAVAINEVSAVLGRFFEHKSNISLAAVDEALIINGARAEIQRFETTAPGILRFLSSVGLKSIAFTPSVTQREFVDFFSAVATIGAEPPEEEFWINLVAETGIRGILLNQSVYGVAGRPQGKGAPEGSAPGPVIEGAADGQGGPDAGPVPAQDEGGEEEALTEEALVEEAPSQGFGETIRGFCHSGSDSEAGEFLAAQARDYAGKNNEEKREMVRILEEISQEPDLASRPGLMKALAGPLADLLGQERDPGRFQALFSASFETAANLVRTHRVPEAALLYGRIRDLREGLAQSAGGEEENLSALVSILETPVSDGVARVIAEAAVSGDPEKQPAAVGLLGELGFDSASTFVEIIKETKDLGTRQLAASWVRKAGEEAVALLREEALVEPDPDRRIRIIEVLENVCTDLECLLPTLLDDGENRVRLAAITLAERLKSSQATQILIQMARGADPNIAVPSIRSLGKIRFSSAAVVLTGLLKEKRDPKIHAAVCTSLGQIAHPGSVDALEGVLRPKRFLGIKRFHPPLVRSSAAFALGKIGNEKSLEILEGLVQDADPRVQEAAKKALAQAGKKADSN